MAKFNSHTVESLDLDIDQAAQANKQLLKTVAKDLGVAKGAIKQLITDDLISYERINAQYYVDADEVREALADKNKFSLGSELKKILNLTAGDLTMLNHRSDNNNSIVLGAIADCKEIVRHGVMVPSNCTNIITYIQSSPFVNMKVPFGQDKIGWTIYEHKQIMQEFNKTMEYSSIGSIGYMVQYK